MKNLAYDILGGLLLLVIGFLIGWHAKGVSVKAGQVNVAVAQTKAVVTGVTQQATAQHAAQVVEQGKSVALAADQSGIRTAGADIRLGIDNADFKSFEPIVTAEKPAVAVVCPDTDPVGSDDFVRLYNASASGADPAAAATTSAR